jgi:hypothetical protein
MASNKNGRGALQQMGFVSIMLSGTRHSSTIFRHFGAALTMRHDYWV